jgi:PTS system nitrogen regulatory IIA component
MHLIDILARRRVIADAKVSSKKRLLELAASVLCADTDREHERLVFESLVAREHLGSTGLGGGVAIPHGRIAADIAPTAAFIRLTKPLDFDAADGEPVDLVLALIVPDHFTDQHLTLLAQVAELFSQSEICAQLRAAKNHLELFDVLSARTLKVADG